MKSLRKALSFVVAFAMIMTVLFTAGVNTVDAAKKVKVKSITLSETSLTLTVGEKATLKATVSPKNATNKKVSFTSSKSSIASVNAKGVIKAKKAGTAKITVKAKDGSGKKAVATVKVVKKQATAEKPEESKEEESSQDDEPAPAEESSKEEESKEESKSEEKSEEESKEETSTETAYPKATLEGEAKNINAEVKAPEGALPEGASMSVTDVAKSKVEDAVKTVVKDADGMKAIDISFKNAEGEEIEPKKDVTVTLTADVASKPNLQVVHIADDGKATLVENVKIDADKGTITFKQDEFSTFVLTWTAAENASATIHYGYMDGTTFKEFDKETSLDTSVGSFSLHALYDGYTYQQPFYSATATTNPTNATSIGDDIFKVTAENGTYTWQYTEAATEQQKTIANGSHIYAVYMKLPEEVTPDPDVTEVDADDDPLQTQKSVVANKDENGHPDGTYRITLSITGAVETETIHPTADVIIVFDRSGSMRFNGTTTNVMQNYGPGRRDYTAIQATKSLTTELLKNNTEQYPDTIHMSIVQFGDTASTVVTNSKDEDDLLEKIDGLRGIQNNGTNWEHALQTANNITTRAGANVYVIFVSDGNPTRYGTRPNGTGYEDAANITTCYNRARDDARNIVTGGKNFYTLGVFGSVDRMQHLTAYAYSQSDSGTYPAGRYQTATDTDSLNEAFAKIITDINNSFNYTDVEIDDGITEMTSIATQVSGATGNFVYTRDGGDDGNGGKKYDNETWTNAPAASASENGVAWDLGAAGAVESGVTYTVSFDVWPSQESYDLVADLNNGLVEYDELDKSLKDQIQDNGDGTYSLLTNTYLNTTYSFKGKKYKVIADKGEGAMELDDETISIKKYFENKLDAQKLDKIKLTVTKAGADYMDVELTETGNWQKDDIFISCGLMTVKSNNLTIKETGHDYSVSEHNDADDFHWDLEATIYRPMVINGTKTMLIKVVDEAELAAHSSLANNKKDGNYYKFDNTLYKVGNQSSVISAYNRRRSNLNLTKAIQGNAPADALFEYKAKIGKTGDDDIWFSAWDPEAGALVNDLTVSSNVTAATGDSLGYFYVAAGTEFTFSIKAGWNVRFLNMPIDTEYTITETIGSDYNVVSIEAEAVYGPGTEEEAEVAYNPTITLASGKVEGKIENSNTSYTLTYTNEMKYFYVYHSSDNTIERIAMTDKRITGGKFDMTAEVKGSTENVPPYLYGGYFKAYGGQKNTDAQTIAATYTNNWASDATGATPYTGSKATAWKAANAYTEKGTAMTPVSGTVYYLKEVPNAYLRPYIQIVYDKNGNNKITALYCITAVDDANYTEAGFNNGTSDSSSTSLSATIKITNKSDSSTSTLTAKGLFNGKSYPDGSITLPRGYLTSIETSFSSQFEMQPYFKTLDGVKVYGVTNRKVNPGNGTFVDNNGVGQTPGITTTDETKKRPVE